MAKSSCTGDGRKAVWQSRFVFILLTLGALAPVAVYASGGTVVLLIMAVAALGNLSSVVIYLRRWLSKPFGLALAALIAWSFVTTQWGQSSGSAALAALRVVLLCLAGVLFLSVIDQLEPNQRRIARLTLVAAGFGMLIFFAVELVTDGALAAVLKRSTRTNLNSVARGTAILVVLTWPIFAILASRERSRALAVGFIVGAFAVTAMLPMAATVVAFGAGLIAFVAVYLLPRPTIVMVIALYGVLTLAAPAISLNVINLETLQEEGARLPTSWQHRLAIWQFISTRIGEKPIAGHGFDSSRNIGGERQAVLLKPRANSQTTIIADALPLHPHNAPLQIWLELGFIGVLCMLGMLFGVCRVVWRYGDRPLATAAMGASIASFLCIASLSFGIWQNWWLATGWLAAGVLALVAPDLPGRLVIFGGDSASRK